MRIFISQIKSTTMSIRNAFKSVFGEIDELKEEIQKLRALIVVDEAPEAPEPLTADNYSESEDKEKVSEFAESIGLEVDKRKGIDTVKKEIEEKLQGE